MDKLSSLKEPGTENFGGELSKQTLRWTVKAPFMPSPRSAKVLWTHERISGRNHEWNFLAMRRNHIQLRSHCQRLVESCLIVGTLERMPSTGAHRAQDMRRNSSERDVKLGMNETGTNTHSGERKSPPNFCAHHWLQTTSWLQAHPRIGKAFEGTFTHLFSTSALEAVWLHGQVFSGVQSLRRQIQCYPLNETLFSALCGNRSWEETEASKYTREATSDDLRGRKKVQRAQEIMRPCLTWTETLWRKTASAKQQFQPEFQSQGTNKNDLWSSTPCGKSNSPWLVRLFRDSRIPTVR